MEVGREKREDLGLARDGRGRMVITGEQSESLGAAVRARHLAKGWPLGSRSSTSSFYDLAGGRPALYLRLSQWSRRMWWTPGSAEGVALRDEEPTPLEELPARLRWAVESRCADKGWDPAVTVAPGMWAALGEGRLPALGRESKEFYDALFDALGGEFPPATVQALLDLDAAMQWVPRSAEQVLRQGGVPTPLEGDASRVVVELDLPPGAVTLGEWFQVTGRAATAAPQMTDEERGRLAAVLGQMLDDWEQRRGH